MAWLKNVTGGTTSLKDLYRDKVLNGTFDDTCTGTPKNNVCTINEGGCGVDTTNKIVYLYYDLTMNTSPSSSSWATLLEFSDNLSNYLPRYTANNRNTLIGLCTDSTSSNAKEIFIGYAGSGYARNMGIGYGQGASSGDRFIVYSAWSYQ